MAPTSVYCTPTPSGIKLSHTWRTNIQTTVKGSEKRTALYTWPRIKLVNNYELSDNAKINWLRRNVIFNSDALWYLPVWSDLTELTKEATSGQAILTVSEALYRHFYVNRQVIIISKSDFTSYEVGTILNSDDTITITEITLDSNLTSTWPVGSFVLPLYPCRINANRSIRSSLQYFQEHEIEGNEAYESQLSHTYTLPSSGAVQYLSYDIFLNCPFLPVTYEYLRPYNINQSLGLGYVATKYDDGDNKIGLKTKIPFFTRIQIKNFLNFFDSKMGRLLPFWVPTWNKDIIPITLFGPTDTQISIQGINYDTLYFLNDINGRHIFVYFPDGSYRCRKIVGATASTITLDNALGVEITSDQLDDIIISFLYFCRFDIDEVEINYPMNMLDVAESEVDFSVLISEDL